jgi:excisionase family DNA binding protein
MTALLSPEEVAGQCGLSRKAVYRAIDRGELRASRLCSRLRIRPEDVESWISANEVGEEITPARRRAAPRPSPSSNGLRTLLAQADN